MSSKSLTKLQKLQDELNANIVERANEVEGSLAALIAKVHVLFLGPPGTAKSLLAENICEALIGGKFFRWLMTKYTTPEELFGPPSLKGLENDEYRRITKNKLPEAVIAFLDEIFKPNSAILNTLLTALNERKFDNNGDAPMDIPLLSCFGASNELPQGEELGALYDRFLMRYWVKEIQDDNNFCDLLSGKIGENKITVQLSTDEIDELHKMAAKVTVTQEMLINMRKVQADLRSQGIKASDRRWKSAVGVLQALALLRGLDEVTGDELEALADMLWDKPEDRRAIFAVVSQYGNPLNLKAIEYLDMGKEVYDKWHAAPDADKEMAAIQAHKQIKEILKSVKDDVQGRSDAQTRKLVETQAKLQGYLKTLTLKMMDVDV